jgi:uncharacterized repeat protein (TIGR01451 family)
MSFTGVDTTGTSGSGAIGNTGTGNSSKGAPTASLTTIRAGSLVVGVGNDWDNAINRTAGTGQTVVHTDLAPVGDTYWVQRQINTTPTSGTSVPINDTAPSTDRYNLSTAEVLAAINVAPTPDLTITKTHSGSFAQGQIGAAYTITVKNSGAAASSGTVTVNDTLPTGLAAAAISGNNWSCALSPLSCTRGDALAAGVSYDVITLTVNVAANAPASITNTATVSGGSDGNTTNNTATDVTAITTPDLTITKTHSGNFAQGQVGATYTITVKNSGGAATSGAVTVNDTLPASLTATAISGTNWACSLSPLSCTRSDVLAAGVSYDAITLTVTVAANAPASITNTATVSGGNDGNTSNNTANDVTTVTAVVGPPSSITSTGGTPQSAPINTAFSVNLQVTVKDANGNPVNNGSVVFTAPSSGPSGTFSSPGSGNTATVSTGSNGVATAPTFTANATGGGPYTVTAKVGSVGPANFSLTNTSGPPLLYPDLQDILPTNLMSIVKTSSGKQFQYTHDTLDAGPGALVIQPVYNAASGSYQGTQYIYTQNSSGSWTLSKQIPIAGAFFFDADHGHFHFPFVTYGLYNVGPDGGPGSPVAVSAKIAFCINDSFIYLPNIKNAGQLGNLGPCTNATALRGLDIGAVDEYDQTDEGQAIEIDNLPDGTYWLRAIDDPNNFLAEADKTNNETDVELSISGTTLTVLKTVVPVINNPPDLTLNSPANGAVVSGTIPLSASSLTTTSGASFLIDGVTVNKVIPTGSYTAAWDTTTVPNGTHWIAAQTVDSSGIIGTSAVAMVTVSNNSSPATTVQVSSPAAGSILSATVTLYATVATSQTISNVAFYIDGTQVGSVTAAPYMITWDTTSTTSGSHTLTASATNTLNNIVYSVPLTITVNNTNPAKLISTDATVSVNGHDQMYSPLLSTSAAGELVLAFVSYDGPSNGAQTANVAGAGLKWTLLTRSNTAGGTSEIWSAWASFRLLGTSVVTVPGITGYDGSLTVVAFTNAVGTSVVSRTGGITGAPDIYLPGVIAGDWVFAAGNDFDHAATITPVTGQVVVHQYKDTKAAVTFWVQSTSTPSTANALVDIHDNAPTSDHWNYAAVEVVAAHQ